MPEKILIASDSFKGSASSLEVGQAMAEGVRSVLPDAQIEVFAVADGGEGTVEAFATNAAGSIQSVLTVNPAGRPIEAKYFLSQDKSFAVLEVAQASGLTTVAEDDRRLLELSSFGTGLLIKSALDQCVKEIYLGLGGSATNDMGLGIAAALGARFTDASGQTIEPIPTHFKDIASIDLAQWDPRINQTRFILLADVTNPLCGPNGASAVFGPQKGASPADVAYLDQALTHVTQLIARDYDVILDDLVGGGAAGGMGAGLSFFLSAELRPGIETLLDLAHFSQALEGADLILTGEGRLDEQSIAGKVPIGVAKLANRYKVPTVALVGSFNGDLSAAYQAGLAGVFSISSGPMTLEEAMTSTLPLVTTTSRNLMTFYKTVNSISVHQGRSSL